MESEIISTKK